jgi:hypothetical protein
MLWPDPIDGRLAATPGPGARRARLAGFIEPDRGSKGRVRVPRSRYSARSTGRFSAEKNVTDSDFVQITATTHDATGQVLLYALTRAGDVWQFDFNKHRWEILPATRA